MDIKPLVASILTFSMDETCYISFSYSGNQFFAVELLITDLTTNAVLYNPPKITTMKSQYVLSPYELEHNGVSAGSYAAQIRCWSSNGDSSLWSDKVYLTCITKPTFEFSELDSTTVNTINNSFINCILNYSQAENVLIKEYKISLYDTSGKELSSSGVVSNNVLNENNLRYTFKNLDNNTFYNLKAECVTVNGYSMETSIVQLFTSYVEASSYNVITATNDKKNGYIKYSTNIISVEGVCESGNLKYDNNGIDLRDDKVIYNQGFNINGDFSMKIIGRNFTPNSTILSMNNGLYTIEINYYKYMDKNYFRLVSSQVISEYVLYSDRITIAENQQVAIIVIRKGSLYQLTIL